MGSCCWKVGICGVVGVWKSTRMEVSRGSLMLLYAGKGNMSIYCKVGGGMVSIKVYVIVEMGWLIVCPIISVMIRIVVAAHFCFLCVWI